MTTVVVLADDPVESADPLPALRSHLSPAAAAGLYRAMLADVCEVVQRGGADLLVNYPDSSSPQDGEADGSDSQSDAEGRLRTLLGGVVPDADAVRYEPQVGSTDAARVGNALTHLLEEAGEPTVAVVEPTAPFLRREHVGTAAMKLRTSEVVLGPAPGGRVTFAGFREPIDFADVYATPALETFTRRAVDADLDVDFLPMTPLVSTPDDLPTAVSTLAARRAAGRAVPPRTAAQFDDLGLAVDAEGGVSRPSDND